MEHGGCFSFVWRRRPPPLSGYLFNPRRVFTHVCSIRMFHRSRRISGSHLRSEAKRLDNMVACIKAVQEFRMRGRILSENNHTMGPLVYQPLPHGQQAKRAPRARPTRVLTTAPRPPSDSRRRISTSPRSRWNSRRC